MIITMTPQGPAVSTDGIGATSVGRPHTVERDAVLAFARATNDSVDHYDHLGITPPFYVAPAAVQAHAELYLRLIPPELVNTSIHIGESLRWIRPLRIGETLISRSTLVRAVGSRVGCTLAFEVETRTSECELVAESSHRVLLRGVRGGARDPGAEPTRRSRPAHRLGEVSYDIDADQSIRYSHASGDLTAIHTDPEIARRNGFPGLILHGMCTLALCGRAITALAGAGDPTLLRSLEATFSRPVIVGRKLHVAVDQADDGGILFGAHQGGRPVIRNGCALVGPQW